MADIEKKRRRLNDKLEQIVEGRFTGSETKEQLEADKRDLSQIQENIRNVIDESGVPKRIKAMVQEDNLEKFNKARYPASSKADSGEAAAVQSAQTKLKAHATGQPTVYRP